jgi:cytochrome c-type biogenesis protein CcmH/NrfF
MRCYYHREVEAVATCRSCCRGLCDACAVEVDKLSACRDRCEADVAAMRALVVQSHTAFATGARQLRIASLICILFAGLFVLLSRRPPYSMATWLLLPAAFVLLIGAALLVVNARRYETKQTTSVKR